MLRPIPDERQPTLTQTWHLIPLPPASNYHPSCISHPKLRAD